MTKLNYISAVILLAAASVAHAQTATPAPRVPGNQGTTGVDKDKTEDSADKTTEDADSKNTESADQQQIRERQQERIRNRYEGTKIERPSSQDKVDRPGSTGRPGK